MKAHKARQKWGHVKHLKKVKARKASKNMKTPKPRKKMKARRARKKMKAHKARKVRKKGRHVTTSSNAETVTRRQLCLNIAVKSWLNFLPQEWIYLANNHRSGSL